MLKINGVIPVHEKKIVKMSRTNYCLKKGEPTSKLLILID